jgi:Helicase conserved C-terminal domain
MRAVQRDVVRMLKAYSRRAVETWARARGIDPDRFRGDGLIEELAETLLTSAALKAALAEISHDERIALARVKQAKGQIWAQELYAQLLADDIAEPDAVVAQLMARGLLFYDRMIEGYGSRVDLWGAGAPVHFPHLWLPHEVSELVTIPSDLGRLPLAREAASPSRVQEPAFGVLQRDLYLILQAVRENPIKLLKSGAVGKRDSQRLLQILPGAAAGESDPTAKARSEGAWFEFLWLLIQRAGLTRVEESRLVVSDDGARFLRLPEAEQARRLLQAWVHLPEWSEFVRVPTLAFDSAFGDIPAPYQVVAARGTLLELLLRERPFPDWYSFPSLLASMKRYRVGFLIPQRTRISHYPWQRGRKEEGMPYVGIYAKGSSPRRLFDKQRDWEHVEGAFLRTVFEESLLWMGLARLGYEDGRLMAFQFTERGAAALGLIEATSVAPAAPGSGPGGAPAHSAAAPAERTLVVQPNFEVVAYMEADGVSLLVELDRFAERVRLDRAALYRLTRASLYRGLQDGLTLADVLRTLETRNGGPLPQNVAYSLAEWERLYQRIHVQRAVTLVEAGDDAELQALRALPELANAREVAPRLLALPPGVELSGLRRRIQAFDYTAPIADVLQFETATRFRVLPGALTPRLRHRLLQLADEATPSSELRAPRESRSVQHGARSTEHGAASEASYTLSREKIAQVARSWGWEAIHAFLVGAAKKKPGPELAVTLKGWTGALARATLAPATVLAAPDAAWLDELLRVPEVDQLIARRLAPRLALVTEENRARLEAALAGIGVPPRTEDTAAALTAAGTSDDEEGEVLLIGPPRKRRALIEQAIAMRRRLVIATMAWSGSKLDVARVDPVRIEGEGAGATLYARIEGYRHEHYYPLNRIQGVRMLDEPIR